MTLTRNLFVMVAILLGAHSGLTGPPPVPTTGFAKFAVNALRSVDPLNLGQERSYPGAASRVRYGW